MCALRLASQEHGYAALAAGAGYAAGPSLQGSSSAGCWAAGEGGLPLAAPAEGEIALHRALLLPSSTRSAAAVTAATLAALAAAVAGGPCAVATPQSAARAAAQMNDRAPQGRQARLLG